jgi:hypothetical protein
MKREHFVKVVEEVLDSLPREFRSRIRNVASLVEDFPPNQALPQSGQQRSISCGRSKSRRTIWVPSQAAHQPQISLSSSADSTE